MELEMEKVNPVVYWLKLMAGIFSVLLSIMLWVQMYKYLYLSLLSQLVFPSSDGHGSVFLD
jgi:hypothetical protein